MFILYHQLLTGRVKMKGIKLRVSRELKREKDDVQSDSVYRGQ